MKTYPRRYAADLVRTTSIRIAEGLREEAEEAAAFSGMTFGQFVRQSLRRNINAYRDIEKEVSKQAFHRAAGKTEHQS